VLGLVWLPALAVGVVLAGRGRRDVARLLALGLGLTLIFFLTRPWLSETNAVLLVAPGLVLAAIGRLDRRLYTALWVLPFLMTLTYLWPVKLLWAVAPATVADAAFWAEGPGDRLLLAARAAVIVAWQAAGWTAVIVCLRRSPARQRLPESEGRTPLSPTAVPPPASGPGATS
jgi:hypothetical protein